MRFPFLAAALALIGASGCVVHTYAHDAPYTAVQYRYMGAHPLPDGDGWCFLEYEHVHDYAPDYSVYTYRSGVYVYSQPALVWYVGYHPIPTGGYCTLAGRHSHSYVPGSAFANDYEWDRGQRVYVYRNAPPPPGHGVTPVGPPPRQGTVYLPPPPPGTYNPPPGHGGIPPGHGGMPPGHGDGPPPGQINNPGRGGHGPPGHSGGPPGQENRPPPMMGPPGYGGPPPGHGPDDDRGNGRGHGHDRDDDHGAVGGRGGPPGAPGGQGQGPRKGQGKGDDDDRGGRGKDNRGPPPGHGH